MTTAHKYVADAESTPGGELTVVDTLDAVAALQTRIGDLFLRISVGPADDRGRDPRDAESEFPLPGIPVYPLRPEPWWDGGARLWVARQLVYRGERFAGRRRMHPWLATGTVVGRSAWGEPLLAQWSPVAFIGPRVLTQAGLVYAGWRSGARDASPVRHPRRRSRPGPGAAEAGDGRDGETPGRPPAADGYSRPLCR